MHKLICIILLITFVSSSLPAQELNCKVDVNSDQIPGSDKRVFESMKTALFEFMNNRKWTNDIFKSEERIECNILINITARPETDRFDATIQIQARRPVYKSSYNSVLLNYEDKDLSFNYIESTPLDFSENTYIGNLTSVMGFYAYMILGLDYDSFSLNGGTPYFQKALSIVNNAQNSGEKGWKAFDGTKNRYWLVNNMVDASFVPLRECMYNYHRKGLDLMLDNKDAGRSVILESIESLKKVHDAKPLSFNLADFFISNSDEIINIFSGGVSDEKAKMIVTLNDIDPTNSNKYQRILSAQ